MGDETKMKDINIDLDVEQSVKLTFSVHGERIYSMLIFKEYPNIKAGSPYRNYKRRVAKGFCLRFGCPNKALKGFKSCAYHLELDRLRYKEKKSMPSTPMKKVV